MRDRIKTKAEHHQQAVKEQGLVEVIDFGLNIDEIEVKVLVISTNDCVYKRQNQYKYHVQVDTDEFIVSGASQPSQ